MILYALILLLVFIAGACMGFLLCAVAQYGYGYDDGELPVARSQMVNTSTVLHESWSTGPDARAP